MQRLSSYVSNWYSSHTNQAQMYYQAILTTRTTTRDATSAAAQPREPGRPAVPASLLVPRLPVHDGRRGEELSGHATPVFSLAGMSFLSNALDVGMPAPARPAPRPARRRVLRRLDRLLAFFSVVVVVLHCINDFNIFVLLLCRACLSSFASNKSQRKLKREQYLGRHRDHTIELYGCYVGQNVVVISACVAHWV